MQNFIDENPVLLREKAAAAYCAGGTEKADLFDALADSLDLIEDQADKIAELENELEERANYSAYKEFFENCFARLDGHYP